MTDQFVIARNPDPDSTLPYLLRLPIDGGVLLKARDTWPTTSRVYCHPLDSWPADAEIVEQVSVRHCARRGAAIDLVLDRGRNNRSQIVFTKPNPGRAGGRPMIFWQTARTAKNARPGQRVPTRRASDQTQLTIDVDTRERYPYKFANRPVERTRSALPAGDYAIRDGDRIVAVVERKTPEDFNKSLVDGTLNYRLAELAALPAAAVVVEQRYGALLNDQYTQPGWLLELVARLQVRYPAIPIVFADSRKLAEEYTYRYLAAALVHHAADDDDEA
ncbi:MAG: ERCC4 domain-containing protein [Vicinamibacterales bacterium]